PTIRAMTAARNTRRWSSVPCTPRGPRPDAAPGIVVNARYSRAVDLDGRPRCELGAAAVRVHDLRPYRLSRPLDRPGKLPRRALGTLAVDRARGLSCDLQLLEAHLRLELRHGRRLRRRPEPRVRHQLERLRRQGRPHRRPADGL